MIAVVAGTAVRARARHLRVAVGYCGALLLGVVLYTAVDSPPWQAFGIGLWLPGAGFLAAGAGWPALFVAVVLLFLAAIVAWIELGAGLLPPLVWVAAAVGATGAVDGRLSDTGVQAAFVLLLLAVLAGVGYGVERVVRLTGARTRREGRLPYRYALVRATTAASVRDRNLPDELTAADLAAARFVLDRALQPVGSYDDFEQAFPLGPAALHRQITTFGYALALLQRHYTPNLRGYVTEAQRRLVETFLPRPVWQFWRTQNLLGHLRTGADPVGAGRMAVTGAFALQVALYTRVTGDGRFLRLNALSLRDGDARRFPHDLREMADALDRTFTDATFCLAPGAGDWIDVLSNARGLCALRVFDAIAGTDHAARHMERFRTALEDEFFFADLGLVAARSARTGLGIPAGTSGAALAVALSPLFPDTAARCWALAREEHFDTVAGELVAAPAAGARLEHPRRQAAAFEALWRGAQEHGDVEAAAAARDAFERVCAPVEEAGVLHYERATHVLTAAALFDRLLFCGGWRRAVLDPLPPAASQGPVLDTDAYPDVLVAMARSTGRDLQLVLHPGAGDGVRDLTLANLRPGQRYEVCTADRTRQVVATADGRAVVDVALAGRTEVTVRPC